MKRIILIVVLVLLAISFVPVSVTGNVYVVTKGMTTVPMPLTEVKVYDAAEFNRVLETKKLDYIKNCSQLPEPDEMTQLELNAIKGGPEAIKQFLEHRKQIAACSTASFLSSKEYLTPIQTVITNKDGEFNLKVNRFGTVVVVAEGKRAVAGGEETYIWLAKFKPSITSFIAKLEINNKNEMSSTPLVELMLLK